MCGFAFSPPILAAEYGSSKCLCAVAHTAFKKKAGHPWPAQYLSNPLIIS
jgi:hypothetical protein